MDFVLATLAFAQLVFLPGALLLRATGLRFGPLGSPVAAFALSAIANYVFVLLAVICGVFNQASALAFVGVELLLAAWLWRADFISFAKADFGTWLSARFVKATDALRAFVVRDGSVRAFPFFALLAAFVALLMATLSFLDSAGGIFNAWDAVLSWNRWANAWLAGSYPEWTNGYPQLIPMNWALCYSIQGNSLQFVPKLTTELYALGVLVALFDIAFLRRSAGALLAAPLFLWLLHNVQIGAYGGDVDVAVTFMAFAAFHALVRAASGDAASLTKSLFAVSLFAAGAAAAKQAGLFILVMIVPMAFFLLKPRLAGLGLGTKRLLKPLLVHLLLALVIAAPCYACAKYMVEKGRDKYKVAFVTEEIYGQRGHLERSIISSKMFLLRLGLGMHEIPGARWTHVALDKGISGVIEFFKPYRALSALMALFALLLVYLGTRSGPLGLWPFLFIGAPLTCVWALLYCYDLRNLCSALPFLALTSGLGLESLATRFRWRGWALLVLLLALYVPLALWVFGDAALKKSHETLEMRVGNPRLNAKLYAYDEKSPIKSRIATDYEFINYLPGLKGLLRYQEYRTKDERWLFDTALSEPSVGFFMIPHYASPDIRAEVEARLKDGSLKLIFDEFNYMFIKIERGAQAPKPKEVE